jgi:hypothetical protein
MAKKAWPQIVACGVAAVALTGMVKHASGDVHAHLTSVPGNGGSVQANISLGQAMASQMGWTGSQWSCLYTLWAGESGWSQYSDTRKSGLDAPDATVFAYGIPQSRPATKMPRSARPASLGGRSKPKTQIRWGLGYIQSTYGDPCSALAYKRSTGNQGY